MLQQINDIYKVYCSFARRKLGYLQCTSFTIVEYDGSIDQNGGRYMDTK